MCATNADDLVARLRAKDGAVCLLDLEAAANLIESLTTERDAAVRDRVELRQEVKARTAERDAARAERVEMARANVSVLGEYNNVIVENASLRTRLERATGALRAIAEDMPRVHLGETWEHVAARATHFASRALAVLDAAAADPAAPRCYLHWQCSGCGQLTPIEYGGEGHCPRCGRLVAKPPAGDAAPAGEAEP